MFNRIRTSLASLVSRIRAIMSRKTKQESAPAIMAVQRVARDLISLAAWTTLLIVAPEILLAYMLFSLIMSIKRFRVYVLNWIMAGAVAYVVLTANR